MKRLHRPDLFGWSRFDETRDIDFHSVLWVRESGSVAIDPLPLSAHDAAHLQALGGVAFIVVTNSDHVRDARALAQTTGARVLGPAGERERFGIQCHGWLSDGDEPVPGLRVFALEGSKTAGELALLIEDTTLVTGDLIRAHQAGSLTLLPDAKLTDRRLALRSVQRLAELPRLQAVLTGDGWPIFRDGASALRALLEQQSASLM